MENQWLRSWSDETYLWYDEIPHTQGPEDFSDPIKYFDTLKTPALTPSGQPRDKPGFHFTRDTEEYKLLSSGTAVGYGFEFSILARSPPRQAIVHLVHPNTPAANAGMDRGTQLLAVDNVDLIYGTDVDTINAGLNPRTLGERHVFQYRTLDGTVRTTLMHATTFSTSPVPITATITTPTGTVGYLSFLTHNRVAEQALFNSVEALSNANVSDLILDLRYNGGGLLYVASQLAYMIAGPTATQGRTFELLKFNDKHPDTDPVTGETLAPIGFVSTGLGFSVTEGQALPYLGLSRVFVLTGGGTASASEAIINGLRGINFEVIQIGGTTYGKPYGFYPTDNCGTTYFTVQFEGQNDAGFSSFSDGFSPQNAPAPQGVSVPGCYVEDDFGSPQGDLQEDLLATALLYRQTQVCPGVTSAAPPQIAGPLPSEDEGQEIFIDNPMHNKILTPPR